MDSRKLPRLQIKKTNEEKNCNLDEIDKENRSKKKEKACMVLNYIDKLLIFVYVDPGCFSISAFTSLIAIATSIAGASMGLKVYVISAENKKHQ